MKKTPILDWKPDDKRCVRIAVEPWRFGIMFGPEQVEGEIHCKLLYRLSHSKADTIPSADHASFLHHGVRYAGISHLSGGLLREHEIEAYEMELLHPGVITPKRVRFCYSGEQVRLHGKPHVLCRPVRFVSRARNEWQVRWELRQQWAWGGYFALKVDSYAKFLKDGIEDLRETVTDPLRHSDVRLRAEYLLICLRHESRSAAVHLTRNEMKVLTLHDPLFLARPWVKVAAPDSRKATFSSVSADDALAALL